MIKILTVSLCLISHSYMRIINERKDVMGILKSVIYDNDVNRISRLEYIIKSVALNKNWKEFAIMKISELCDEKTLPVFALESHLILISFTMPNAIAFAETIRKKNMFSKIIFYDYDTKTDINSVLKCAPYACLASNQNIDSIQNIIKNVLEMSAKESNMLFFESRRTMLFLPFDKIVYFCSEQHYINVIYNSASETDRFKDKLDNIESKINNQLFVRIHKSYFISLLHISKIDKIAHIIVMDNGDELPISDSYYKNVLPKLRQLCSLKL